MDIAQNSAVNNRGDVAQFASPLLDPCVDQLLVNQNLRNMLRSRQTNTSAVHHGSSRLQMENRHEPGPPLNHQAQQQAILNQPSQSPQEAPMAPNAPVHYLMRSTAPSPQLPPAPPDDGGQYYLPAQSTNEANEEDETEAVANNPATEQAQAPQDQQAQNDQSRFQNQQLLLPRFRANQSGDGSHSFQSKNLRNKKQSNNQHFSMDPSALQFDHTIIEQNENMQMVAEQNDSQNVRLIQANEPPYELYATINSHCILNEAGQLGQHGSQGLLSRLAVIAQFLGLGTKNRYHVRPSERGPFAIYALEVHTPYSKRIIKRSFSEFANLQKILVQLRESRLEVRNMRSGRLESYAQLKQYLPPLPEKGRGFVSSLLSSSSTQSTSSLTQRHKMFNIRHELALYCQQILHILDIFYIHNMKLKAHAEQRKLQNHFQKLYRQFLKEQKQKLKDYEEALRQEQTCLLANGDVKDQNGHPPERQPSLQKPGPSHPNDDELNKPGSKSPPSEHISDGITSKDNNEIEVAGDSRAIVAPRDGLAQTNSQNKQKTTGHIKNNKVKGMNHTTVGNGSDGIDDEEVEEIGNMEDSSPRFASHTPPAASQHSSENAQSLLDQTNKQNSRDRGATENLNSSSIFVGDPEFDDKSIQSKHNETSECPPKSKEIAMKIQQLQQKRYIQEQKLKQLQKMEKFYLRQFINESPKIDPETNESDLDLFLFDQDNQEQYITLQKQVQALLVYKSKKGSREQLQGKILGLEDTKRIRPLPNDPYFWAYEIMKFFQIPDIFIQEKQNALKIEKFLMNCKKVLLKERFKQMIYQLKGMATNLLNLPDQILIMCFQHLETKEQFRQQLVCRRFRKNLNIPFLRKEIIINNNTQIFEAPSQKMNLRRLLETSCQLRVLSLKFCPHLNKEILNIISLGCNPFTLSELYLDGCDGVTDDAFDCLMLTEAEKEEDNAYVKNFDELLIEEEKVQQDPNDTSRQEPQEESKDPTSQALNAPRNMQQSLMMNIRQNPSRMIRESALNLRQSAQPHQGLTQDNQIGQHQQYLAALASLANRQADVPEPRDNSLNVAPPHQQPDQPASSLQDSPNVDAQTLQGGEPPQDNARETLNADQLANSTSVNVSSFANSNRAQPGQSFGQQASQQLNFQNPQMQISIRNLDQTAIDLLQQMAPSNAPQMQPNQNSNQSADHSNAAQNSQLVSRRNDMASSGVVNTTNEGDASIPNSLIYQQPLLNRINQSAVANVIEKSRKIYILNENLPNENLPTLLQEKYLTENNINEFLGQQQLEVLEHIHSQNLKEQERRRQLHALRSTENKNGESIEDQDLPLVETEFIKPTQERIFTHLSRGGLRGLQVLSLSECRNLSDSGLGKLSQLTYIRKMDLLGCTKIEDEGIRLIARQFKFIQELDLGGTSITSTGLRDLVSLSPNLKKVSIMGCKKLNNSDDQILIRRHIDCQGIDDVFRFHLLPELVSQDLPQITKSVLKTRSTLGLNKVYKYLFRRLLALKVDDLLRTDSLNPNESYNESIDQIVPEEKIEILCNGQYLKPTLQLKDVREVYWQEPFENPEHHRDLLILHYRRKFSKSENLAIQSDQRYSKRSQDSSLDGVQQVAQKLLKPQIPVPNHLGFLCSNPYCKKNISRSAAWIFKKQSVNCQRCGNCFCSECCDKCTIYPDNEFGFRSPIKVCQNCNDEIQAMFQR